ncbi:MAG: histidine phosphotransferase family protein [Ferrovibrio sp.]|uniref:histidine phosphotransferase family protein n=1 Tax=Ferrovibrio sp. TaxID=1917215 RepID=UPI0026240CDA|nr:histidine phosphotransferase family protein [Ferrovibrio sp.]MCW0235643.1 histidine phosphotransferase family protein [Ferrovibrio sp.]
MATDDLDLVALICSRLCHDLAGSIGAVNNGVELLAEETDATMREEAIGLIAQSASDAARRLSFFRLALGASGSTAEPMAYGELARVARAYFDGGKLSLLLPGSDESMPKSLGKALLLGLSLAAGALPRGGSLSLIKARDGWHIRAEGTTLRWQEAMAQGLGDAAMPPEPQAAIARYTRRLAESAGYRLQAEPHESSVTLSFAAMGV